MVGRGNRSAVATLVYRHSRLVRLVALPAGHDSLSVRDGIILLLQGPTGPA
ncbi:MULTISPECIES: hypothetical protein [Streptacidiphilus]|uniref:Uncharacterized protein n=1 Tax=Streptacidiphilus cavernicola TaxID=3342716 RepID=A0ABV6UGU4_9ACTN|nr:hypothetical protein [Streptacidiphilus jeojiense]